MYISQFKITNYKSFRETVEVELTPGMNLVTGQNNVGKTALLEALSRDKAGVPHKSLKSLPSQATIIDLISRVSTKLVFSRHELLETLAELTLHIPLPPEGFAFGDFTLPDYTPPSLDRFRQWFFSLPTHTFDFRTEGEEGKNGQWTFPSIPSFGMFNTPHHQPSIYCQVLRDHTTTLLSPNPVHLNRGEEIGSRLASRIPRQNYRFAAERFNLGLSRFGSNSMLAPQADNLPEVLGILQGNGVLFDDFNDAVREILPQIGRITVVPEGTNMQKILVWTEAAYSAARRDLAIALDDSGTGIGQVLAILYIVLTSRSPQVILIDEPQSFLHPGAARKLIELLKGQTQHQYIVSTHSPTIITAAQPKTIILITHDGTESHLEHLDGNDAEQLRKYLDEIGASLADVFGSDGILWVEGPTEEKCYPLIVEQILKKPLMGKMIKAAIATGDFEGKHAERFFEIYGRLSGAQSLIPPAVAFLFDDEGRTEQEKKELQNRSNGLVRFTKRRMYENYLLDPRAIAAVLSTTEGHESEVLEQDVQTFIDEALRQMEYFKPLGVSGGLDWIRADRLLKALFWKLGKLDYRKTTHSVELTQWLVKHDPERLKDVTEMIREGLGWS